jgi:hypothetical protein
MNIMSVVKFPKKLIFVSAFFLPLFLQAQTLSLSPYPQEIVTGDGGFNLAGKPGIYIGKNISEETLFSANQLLQEIKDDLETDAAVQPKFKKASIFLGLTGRDSRFDKLLASLNLSVPPKAQEEGYVLMVRNDLIVVAAHTEMGLFYGVQTLKQLIRANRTGSAIPALTITDWPALRYRGWMDDISRGPIPTVDFVKDCIRKMSEFKQNFFTLYTENTFCLNKYPDIAPPGAFTAAEIAELTNYAAKYHIDIIGNFQSFGHMEKILANPFYKFLGDNSYILNPASEKTYSLLKDIYSEIVPAYKSPFFNINCDETQGLGEGKSKRMADSIGLSSIYAYHINRIDKLLKPYGKRLMMWGDIAVNNSEIISKLPKDLVILSWGYHAAESFDDAILPFKKTGFDFMVAPGVSCWNELWPGMSNAAINISNYVRDGAKLGAMGMMNTAWDDNGHNLFNYNWHGLAWGAECSWHPAPPSSGDLAIKERNDKLVGFNKSFDKIFFGAEGVTDALFAIDSLRLLPVRGIAGERTFWQELLDMNLENTTEEFGDQNMEVINEATEISERIKNLKTLCTRNQSLLDHPLFALDRIMFSAEKNVARIILYEAKETGNAIAAQVVAPELEKLKNDLFGIKKEYIHRWNLENRPWWLDKNLNDYNRLAKQIDNADKKVFIEPQPELVNGSQPVVLSTLFNDQLIVYALDGGDPTLRSQVYKEPLMIDGQVLIKAAVLTGNAVGEISQLPLLVHKGIGCPMKIKANYSTYNPAYAAGGDGALLDGLTGSMDFADGRWQGYQGQDIELEIDLKRETPVTSVAMDFLQNAYSWILLPKDVQIFTSADGENYRLAATITNDVPPTGQNTVIHTFKADFTGLNARYLKIIAHSQGNLPAGHHAAGNPSFMFTDEVIIR